MRSPAHLQAGFCSANRPIHCSYKGCSVKVTVVQKANGSKESVEIGSELRVTSPSVIEIPVGPEQVADFQRSGNNLVIMLKDRSEEHTSELQSLMRISYAVFCLKKKIHQ